MRVRRLILGTIPSVFVLVGVLALATVPASAAVTHKYLSQLPGFRNPTAVAFDAAGDVYIVDTQAKTVDRFNSAGTPLPFSVSGSSKLAGTPSGSFEEPSGVAVNDENGDVYVSDSAGHVVDVFSSSGVYLSQLTGTCKTGGESPPSCAGSSFIPFARPWGLAVDQSTHDLYVTDRENHIVDVFSSTGTYLSQFGGEVLSTDGESVATNDLTGDAYVADSGSDVIDIFDSMGSIVLPAWAGAKIPAGSFDGGFVYVGIDPTTHHVYVADTSLHEVDEFGASTEEEYVGQLTGTPSGPFVRPQAIAVDPINGNLYVADESGVVDVFGPDILVPNVTTEPATEETPRSVTLNGKVSALEAETHEDATCVFAWGKTEALEEPAVACEQNPEKGEEVAVTAKLTEKLQPDTTYYYQLQAKNGKGTNEDGAILHFTTPGPGIESESASDVASTSATLEATLNPHGVSTSYYFQYSTGDTADCAPSTCTSVPVPDAAIGSAEGEKVEQHIQVLTADTPYHYRVVTVGEIEVEPGKFKAEEFEGPERTFTTQTASTASSLPDGRAWELVTPPNEQGAGLIAIGNEQGADIQAAENGDGITYGATAPITANPEGSRSLEVTQAISTRTAPGSWETQDIATPHNEGPTGIDIGKAAEYKLFSSNLSVGLVEPAGDTPLPPLAAGSEKTIYLRRADGSYEALVTAENVPAGTKFGGDGEIEGGVSFVTATPGFSHVILDSREGVKLSTMPGDNGGGLYEWAAGRLQPASVLPNGNFTAASLGDHGFGGEGEVRHAVSDYGSRLVFEATTLNGLRVEEKHLYLRDMSSKETVQIDAAQGAPESTNPEDRYETANSEGSRVFFTSGAQLTASPSGSQEARDLYVFEANGGSGPLAGKLIDLTADHNGGKGAEVLGVIGASEDGTSVYFVANGALGTGSKRGNCERPQEPSRETCNNVYLESYDEATDAWTTPVLVATISGADRPSWGGGTSDLADLTSRVSPNGRYLAFMSERSLTGYDNRDAGSGVPDEEVYLYHAPAVGGAGGTLVCASCNPTGARPAGMFDKKAFEGSVPLVDLGEIWGGRWLAANIPGWTSEDTRAAQYQSRYLSDSGRLFFNSSDVLVPSDVDGTQDVYEYEPKGIESPEGKVECSESTSSGSDVFKPEREYEVEGRKGEEGAGCVALTSAGTSAEESAFLDASETGSDVFFLTSSRLSSRDLGTSYNIYDAHECSASSPCAPVSAEPPPPCDTGDSCKPGPSPQPAIFGAPASATFTGSGDLSPAPSPKVTPRRLTRAQKLAQALKRCKAKPRRKRLACRALARRRYAATRSTAMRSRVARRLAKTRPSAAAKNGGGR